MKISVMFLSSDERYYCKVSEFLHERYGDKFLLTRASPEKIEENLMQFNPDIVLIDEMYTDVNFSLPSKRISTAYITEKPCEETHNGRPCFCKYASVVELNKKILSLVSYPSAVYDDAAVGNFYVFTSATGGSGSTTCAYAFALQKASAGKNVLFMTFDRFFDDSILFPEKAGSLTEFLYALLQKQNIVAKAETLINQDENTRIFYANGVREPIELSEFSEEHAEKTFDAFAIASKAEVVVVDVLYCESVFWRVATNKATNIILVSETTQVSVSKLERFVKTLQLEEKSVNLNKEKTNLLGKMSIVKNKNKSANNSTELLGIKIICSIPKYSGGNFLETANQISRNDIVF